ncbi:phage tail assembly chaperone [Yersinia kristensenii]|uniref:phage tail assembly chaperone n=1 Tax=Yersinia kristensenii TaxID=28152 RepID=UPI00285309F6|nr:phage tail assembly chaperone [Yersinia kristensenii]MDR4898401.1 phage tail assembly chaperone [Yersinia kristensenii]MDX6735360.1 phage tail assembly chaperone [Yersinia kristensenii]
MTKKDLRTLATAPYAGFRHKTVVVPEWDGATVILREASSGAWLRWREVAVKGEPNPDETAKVSIEDQITNNILADVTLFVDVLLDESGQPAFSNEDIPLVAESYGPVHARLLKEALDLSKQDIETAEKK